MLQLYFLGIKIEMKIKYVAIFVVFMLSVNDAHAEGNGVLNFNNFYTPYSNNAGIINPSINLAPNSGDDWIKIKSSENNLFSVAKNQDLTFGEELAIAWNLSDSLSVNLSVFENQLSNNYTASNDQAGLAGVNNRLGFNKNLVNKSINDLSAQQPVLDANRNLTGYKLGISSQLGLGNDYKLNINFDYGQVEGANLEGFQNRDINTTSFALGIRKAKFGASLNTDMYLQEDVDLIDRSRLGLEFDWHFSDDTSISFGTKQRLNKNTNRASTLDSITGNVQYIKFKHNL